MQSKVLLPTLCVIVPIIMPEYHAKQGVVVFEVIIKAHLIKARCCCLRGHNKGSFNQTITASVICCALLLIRFDQT